MTQITDIFFDLDHTLWDFEKNSALAFHAVFAEQRIEADLHEFLSHYVPLNLQYWEKYRNDEISQEDLRRGRLRDSFALMGISMPEAKIDILSEEYIRHLPANNHLFDGALEILDYLQMKYRLHIITNGFQAIQDRKLNNSNISRYFKTITNSEMVGVKKPNPVIFEYALKLAGARKENSIMIGDCIDADVMGALNFGIDAILFNENSCENADIKHVTRLKDLKNYL